MRVLILFFVASLATGCSVTPPEPPEPTGLLSPINKPALSAVEVNETKPEPVKKPRKHNKKKVRHVK